MEVERHSEMLASLHETVRRLKNEASAYGVKNRLAIVNLQEVVQALYHHLLVVDYNSKSFARAHVTTDEDSIQALLKERL